VLPLFDDIARELVRIGHGVEGNEAFIEAVTLDGSRP
jgi:hypothetical protein